jgi:AraC family transcriptional regulator of adaptative response/methylated-DNA-[protein]-cysteine methyltransferase
LTQEAADWRWEALRRRDAGADGRLWYGVLSTGIYCRPSCPSRQPLAENVRFFEGAEEAARAGFRACRRCRPEAQGPTQARAALVARLCVALEERAEPLSLEALAALAGKSPSYTRRVFKEVTGLSPGAWVAARRAAQVQAALQGKTSITEAIYEAGYPSAGGFYERAKEVLGMTPGQYRAGGEGQALWYATAPCALGVVLVASTAQGLCAILLGDEAGALEADLARRFPRAARRPDAGALGERLAQVVALIEAPGAPSAALPLDLQGTAFQRRVWEALRAIPASQTRSYAALAEAIGQPGAARAVASACAANPLAVAVPCHRVVRGDGGLSGYRWGTARKRALLARERGEEVER